MNLLILRGASNLLSKSDEYFKNKTRFAQKSKSSKIRRVCFLEI